MRPTPSEGIDDKSLDLAAYLDISLKPILRKHLLEEDWQRSRYLWARIGYDRVFKATDGEGAEVAEDRGIIAFYAKAPLPAEVWLEARVRTDLRWMRPTTPRRATASGRGDARVHRARSHGRSLTSTSSGSTTRATTAGENPLPAGPRSDSEQALQIRDLPGSTGDRLPSVSSTNAFGVVAKWYY
jgi:hypothetical protein